MSLLLQNSNNMERIKQNIPNFITCLNLAAGCLSIVAAFKGVEPLWGLKGFQWGFIFIAMGALADFLDGFAARLLHAYSNLGKELDSLSDLVTFGVAPALIMFSVLQDFGAVPWLQWTVFLIPICGAVRLARFNIDTRQATTFIGMPIPANAIFWIGYASLVYSGTQFMAEWYWALLAIIVESYLMISPLRLFSLKFKTWGWRGNQWRWLLVMTAAVLVFCMGVPGLMWLIIAYVLYGIFAGADS